MNPKLSRVLGAILAVIAVLGLVLSLAGIIGIWRLKPAATEGVLRNVEMIQTGMVTTADGLVVADQSLQALQANVLALTETISTTARTLNNSIPMVDTFTVLVAEDLPETVRTAQTSLASAQEGARVIDTVLNTLNRIPFIGNIYDPPEVPLHEGLGQVSVSLDALPQTFATMEDTLEVTESNLRVIEADIQEMALQIGTIYTNLEEARLVIGQYQEQLAAFQTQIEELEASLPGWINTLAWTFTLLFLWIGLSQIGLLIHGFELLKFPPHEHREHSDSSLIAD
jgi:hypothetical protein